MNVLIDRTALLMLVIAAQDCLEAHEAISRADRANTEQALSMALEVLGLPAGEG